jgi:hypothetical protein
MTDKNEGQLPSILHTAGFHLMLAHNESEDYVMTKKPFLCTIPSKNITTKHNVKPKSMWLETWGSYDTMLVLFLHVPKICRRNTRRR